MAFGALGAALSPDVWVASVFVLFFGMGNGASGVCNALLVQRGASDLVRGRVFTLIMSVNYLFLALGMVARRAAHERRGGALGVGGCCGAVRLAAVVGYVLVRRASGIDGA